ncbi:MAG: T9SS type A sorting domain-containing protein [Bacteroidales bacterium]|jgi:hypothetical protein|nr:T9SS type A sorting domain-containing protein [Bacteroidales bacterium]
MKKIYRIKNRYFYELMMLVLAIFVSVNFGTAYGTEQTRSYWSFDDINGTGGNDGLWRDGAAGTPILSYLDWTLSGAYKGDRCLRFGITSQSGSATTPELNLSGNATLKFKAGAWNDDNYKLTISISGGGTLSETYVYMYNGTDYYSGTNSNWDEYSIDIIGGTPTTKITFEGSAKMNARFFLDEVSIVTNTTEPSINVSPIFLNFKQDENTISEPQAITVSGTYLAESISMTVNGDDKDFFTIDTGNYNALTGGVIGVTFSPDTIREYHASITLSSVNANTRIIELNGQGVNTFTTPDIIITAVSPGGGNAHAAYKQDFVEIFNTTQDDILLDGIYLQYVRRDGSSVAPNDILSLTGTIKAQGFYLIGLANGGTGGNLPAVDAENNTNMSNSDGKIYLTKQEGEMLQALYHNSETIVDVVAWGDVTNPVGINTTPRANENYQAMVRIYEDGAFRYHKNIVLGDFSNLSMSDGTYMPRNSGYGVEVAVALPDRIADISVYPNPASSVMHVKSSQAVHSLSLYNVNGQLVAQCFNQNSIDVSKLKTGVYFVRVLVDGGIKSIAVIKE